jgi:hypothetical protein
MARKYHQGTFTPKNPRKYVGKVGDIYYRSSWELKFMKWADANPSVEYWNSEEIVIPYMSPVDNRMHRYFTDFAIQVIKKDGTKKKYIVEIKPEAQTLPPKKGKRSTDKYINELSTYAVNKSKWSAADNFCKKNGLEFIVLTEKHLF